MAKNGFQAFDNDMHVFEPADLYTKYMRPKWGERIPLGNPRNKHGMTRYFLGDGKRRSGRQTAVVVAFAADHVQVMAQWGYFGAPLDRRLSRDSSRPASARTPDWARAF